MKINTITATAASILLLTSACTVEQKTSGIMTVDGHDFNYVRTHSEQPTPFISTTSDGFYYKIAFPDGTTKTVGGYERNSDAWDAAQRTAKDWLDSRKTREDINDKKALKPKKTEQPKPATKTEVVVPELGGM